MARRDQSASSDHLWVIPVVILSVAVLISLAIVSSYFIFVKPKQSSQQAATTLPNEQVMKLATPTPPGTPLPSPQTIAGMQSYALRAPSDDLPWPNPFRALNVYYPTDWTLNLEDMQNFPENVITLQKEGGDYFIIKQERAIPERCWAGSDDMTTGGIKVSGMTRIERADGTVWQLGKLAEPDALNLRTHRLCVPSKADPTIYKTESSLESLWIRASSQESINEVVEMLRLIEIQPE